MPLRWQHFVHEIGDRGRLDHLAAGRGHCSSSHTLYFVKGPVEQGRSGPRERWTRMAVTVGGQDRRR